MLKRMLIEVYKMKVIDLLVGRQNFFPRINTPDDDDTFNTIKLLIHHNHIANQLHYR
jgi:hypothetical protein